MTVVQLPILLIIMCPVDSTKQIDSSNATILSARKSDNCWHTSNIYVYPAMTQVSFKTTFTLKSNESDEYYKSK